MKRKILILFLCFMASMSYKAMAQLPQISDGETEQWYYIYSASTSFARMYITDVDADASEIVKFELQAKMNVGSDYAQQWKIIKPVNATNDNVHFVNRATQNIIQTKFDFNGYYSVQSTTDVEQSSGWIMEVISGSQIKISGKDETGATGYLNAAPDQRAIIDIPIASGFRDSTYSWMFAEAEEGDAIEEVENPFEGVNIYVENRVIIVENADDYALYHISGIPVDKDAQHPAGVYLVKIQGKAQTILVK